MLKFFKFKIEEQFVQVKEGPGRSYWLTRDAYRDKLIEEQKAKCREYLSGTGMSRSPIYRTDYFTGRWFI